MGQLPAYSPLHALGVPPDLVGSKAVLYKFTVVAGEGSHNSEHICLSPGFLPYKLEDVRKLWQASNKANCYVPCIPSLQSPGRLTTRVP